ncbi:hypothetical protein AAU57_11550 [Nonlabens sp. YIK11]|uniref:DUF4199 domain-containing protein n=1 Tax=Nonlabens sp. YIK11 TaxID=1453349 RepID=UPI0006DD0C74|nr:DUF4199 domain-containing protein [Nonlabens sp. YIK11]KQC33893.1 hypothetical protein AAU57_11550 [Nonlabens sp. YIK11]
MHSNLKVDNPVDQIVKKNALIIGLISSALVSCSYIYIWINEAYTNLSLFFVIMGIILGLAVFSQIYCKRRLGGFISLKQAVLAFFIVALLSCLAEALTNYYIFVIHDPASQDVINAISEAAVLKQKEISNAPVTFTKKEFTIGEYVQATLTKVLFFTVLGIISGFFIKKNPPA